ncbi:MAG TPA: bifunctional [glutamate--ammonia ligase]-adenylyl-L-tyrosine phosphorylase/[glutamate--ammonia-ligase] adenylyltransferase [Usitatibacter sp.]|nr:bifunctional [glutamate--ammonia ligase]-adenylyl-L-tyrosine phosphorylase/[glutamate--ammonia-ligase] adenylyltransferase [Usitatibacter sp.]
MDRPTPLAFGPALERTLRLSQYVARVAHAWPGIVAELEARTARPFSGDEMRDALGEGADLAARLRHLRARVMVTLAHRDLNGLASLDEVFATMTALADACIEAAAREAHAQAMAAFGAPANGQRLIVAALGKLGGRELNVSSDVDLVFLYGEDGHTDRARPATHHELFAATGKALIALLSEITPEGQAFRVDMRLRPFGDSGPLVASLPALEDYFVAQARPWERYAWLKSRVVSGPDAGVRERVEPFVYRRYLDYGMLEALREMHGRIAEAAVQRRKASDIKIGAGGIREIEFAAQLFQIVRGGRDAALRTTSTRAALRAIAERGLVERERVAALEQAYAFLRRLEHRLQYYDDQQTQALPRSPQHQALIAEAMDFPDYAALMAELDRHRAVVQQAFEALFASTPGDAPPAAASLGAWLFDPQAAPDPEGLADALSRAGLRDSAPIARRLIDFTRSRRYGALSAGSRGKIEKLLPALVAACAAQGGDEATATRLIALLEAIDRRDAYYSLLVEHPQVLRRAASLVARSAWAARLLARHPILLDELTRTAAGSSATDWPAERAALASECAALAEDPERLLDHLRHFKQRHVLRFTIADLEGELPVMALSDELSALADTILAVTLDEAAVSLGFERKGTGKLGPGLRRDVDGKLGPGLRRDDDASPAIAGFCIVGYGKLGGKELGYGSDLDLIFVYDESCTAPRDRLARVAQRVITWLTSLTAAGVLYEADLRLRPDGASGMLVSSLAAFEEYQLRRAWTWEHQALTRARFCAGDAVPGAGFEAVRDRILAMPRERSKLFAEIVAMRERMRAEHKADGSEIKHIAGGVIDLEFCVQALVLAEGPNHPALRANKGNHMLLRRAGELGLIEPGLANEAADAYLALRARAHRGALNDEEKVRLAPGELEAERAAVTRLWAALFG